ncbi:YwnF family protein [Aquibacillus koreensis]|uniref:YwnF family protein n=1 Tax=Aquibacillus koreensis TaxID=279446 RepID=A0A9X4AGG9_9BACI|nr:YwnF family protein [Aquibacillus koreensis]MCT2537485.1 YwnF family protein [Aquibacillus koreensis]MDC3418931.1 YwnF family protein [Aquibacillus koreensis]
MNDFHQVVNKLPKSAQVELESIQKLIGPIMKVRTRYIMFSVPMITLSLFQLSVLLFYGGMNQELLWTSVFYALLAAIGFALLKEGKQKKLEMQQMTNDYMIDRVNKSQFVSEHNKKEYVELIQQQPFLAINNFIRFLTEEDKIRRTSGNWFKR